MVSTDISVVLPVDELPWLEIVPLCFGKVESALNFSVRVWQEEAPSSVNINSLCII